MTSTSPLRAQDFFHTGIVVADVEAAKEELGHALGVTWGMQGAMDAPILFEEGVRVCPMRFAYSNEGPPYVELVGAVAGTIFDVPGGGTHHVGYWCADLRSTSAALTALGMPRVAIVGVQSEDEDAHWIVHRSPSGLYVELVDEALRAGFESGEPPPGT